ncbi:dihydrolipoyl dehydrogenase [Dethiothermospora halolimnae]|uniref:dihydrolipoyl dehydrogenase n=1 Tax=Dethiothermospora halolimnae TaxID=3114390 RepID=UPI003CCBB7AF
MERDIVIIGGGPGGYVAAIKAAQLGNKVTLVESDRIGGTCLNWGCIPTKALYKNAEIIKTLKNIDQFGISIEGFKIDMEKIHKRKDDVVGKLVNGIEQVLSSYDIETIDGIGSLKDRNRVLVRLNNGEEREISTKNIIIATGSKPSVPPIKGVDLDGVHTSDYFINSREIPKRLAIVGGGVIGLEFANIYNELGSTVTILGSEIIKNVDKDISKRMASYLKRNKIKLALKTRAKEIRKEDGELIVVGDKKGKEITTKADSVLLAVGRKPVLEGLNLDNVGVEYDKYGIKVDDHFRTNIDNIYAIGDVIGGVMLAHVASHEGIIAVEKIMGIEKDIDHDIVPACIFVSPEIAQVGLTEEKAKEKGIDYKKSKFMIGANGKALAMGETQGMVKVLSKGEDNTIIGVHIMGPHASSLIHEGALAVYNKLNVKDIEHTIHAHPTLSESFFEGVLGLEDRAIHMAKPKK